MVRVTKKEMMCFLNRHFRILVILLFLFCLFGSCFAQEVNSKQQWEWETTGQYLLQNHKTMAKACLSMGHRLSERVSLRIEGIVGAIMHRKSDEFHSGGSFYLRYYPLLVGDLRFFVDMGVGIGYSEEVPGKVRPGVCGLLDAGLGVIFPVRYKRVEFVFGWKFSHVSSLRPYDSGLNMQGIMVGLKF